MRKSKNSSLQGLRKRVCRLEGLQAPGDWGAAPLPCLVMVGLREIGRQRHRDESPALGGARSSLGGGAETVIQEERGGRRKGGRSRRKWRMIEAKMYKEERKKELTLLQYKSNISHNQKDIWDKKRETSSSNETAALCWEKDHL